MGTLYVVATPIGNLEDISKRAIDVLLRVDLILSEDTRVAQKLIKHLGAAARVESYHQHSSENTKRRILNVLTEGRNVALVSDAGTPGIADPGNELIDFILARSDAQIVPIPGPSAVSTALSVCGFKVSRYLFVGFWPKKKVSKVIELVRHIKMPFVYFDSPYRVVKNLETIADHLGGQHRVFVGRELTKLHETHYRGTLKSVVDKLKAEKFLKGEIVVVVE